MSSRALGGSIDLPRRPRATWGARSTLSRLLEKVVQSATIWARSWFDSGSILSRFWVASASAGRTVRKRSTNARPSRNTGHAQQNRRSGSARASRNQPKIAPRACRELRSTKNVRKRHVESSWTPFWIAPVRPGSVPGSSRSALGTSRRPPGASRECPRRPPNRPRLPRELLEQFLIDFGMIWDRFSLHFNPFCVYLSIDFSIALGLALLRCDVVRSLVRPLAHSIFRCTRARTHAHTRAP